MRAPVSQVFLVLLALVWAAQAHAQDGLSAGRIQDITAPGLRKVLLSPGEAAASAGGPLLVDVIRHTYSRPLSDTDLGRTQRMRLSLLEAQSASSGRSPVGGIDSMPLPLPASLWLEAVFDGRVRSEALLPALLQSRGASLLYYGLFSLDDETRAWLATEPRLVGELAHTRAGAFVVAAPGLRVRGGAVEAPGGDPARQAWEALVGQSADDPLAFIRALLSRDEGRLAFFFGAMAGLTPLQLTVALRLDDPDVPARVDAARRLASVFDRVTRPWRVEEHVFWRPPLDPALLLQGLTRDSSGRPLVPGTDPFWSAVFGDRRATSSNRRTGGDHTVAAHPEVDFAWLAERVFRVDRSGERQRYDMVLFASRLGARQARWSDPDVVQAVRAAEAYPALILSLERAGLADPAAYAAAARRAASIGGLSNAVRATRTLTGFQGTVALVTRAAQRGGVDPNTLSRLISSLAAVDLSSGGDYEGRLVRWLSAWLAVRRQEAPAPLLDIAAAGSMEHDALVALAGAAGPQARDIEWEGTRYRLDFAAAEAARLARLLGDDPRPYLTTAGRFVEAADVLTRGALTPDVLRDQADLLGALGAAVGLASGEGWDASDGPRRYRDALRALRRAAPADVQRAPRLTSAILELADDLLARGLMELSYTVAFGHPGRAAIAPAEAAQRHRFGPTPSMPLSSAWQFPTAGTAANRSWHVTGALLGLDVTLADLTLRRLSMRPLLRPPTLPTDQRRVLVSTVALVDPQALQDDDLDAIVTAIRAGRARLLAARAPEDGTRLAEELRLSAGRRTLLAWVVAHDRTRLSTFLSPSELLWLGRDAARVPLERLHAWGAPAWPRTGCLCLELPERQPWELLDGRGQSGALASGFPDLNLRLAELLGELRMPAALLAPVLAAATLDLVETAVAPDGDDRRAQLAFLQALTAGRVEEYLALLTTDGPLVPIGPGQTP